MITMRALIACDGIWDEKPCTRTWIFRGGGSWHQTIDTAVKVGWRIDRSGDWCPNHATAAGDLMGATLRRAIREAASVEESA